MKELCTFLMLLLTINPLASQSDASSTNSYKELESELTGILGAGEAGASVLAMQRGEILYRSSFGLANVELGVPMEPSMSFRIGSLSKQFTAVAVMILREQGKLDIDLPVTRYLHGCPSWYKHVSIRQLLNHTSGIPNFTGLEGIRERYSQAVSVDELLALIYSRPADFEPGTSFNYSNSGYVILGRIIENICGHSLQEYIAEVIFKPAGMKHTMFWDEKKVIRGQVQGYEVIQGDTVKAGLLHPGWTYGGGGILSNVDDMAAWMNALLEHRLISAQSLKICFSRSFLKDGTMIDYGLGWYIGGEGDHLQIYHEGGVYGFVAYQSFIPSQNIYVIVLRNLIDFNTRYPAGRLASLVAYRLTGDDPADPVEVKGGLGQYAGDYRIDLNNSIRRIAVLDDKLYYLSPPRDSTKEWNSTQLIPASDSIFTVRKSQSYFKFFFDEKYQPIGFSIIQPGGGREIQAERYENP